MDAPKPSIGDLAGGCARWWAVYTAAFFLTFPLWGHAFVVALRFVLEGLNSFGSAG